MLQPLNNKHKHTTLTLFIFLFIFPPFYNAFSKLSSIVLIPKSLAHHCLIHFKLFFLTPCSILFYPFSTIPLTLPQAISFQLHTFQSSPFPLVSLNPTIPYPVSNNKFLYKLGKLVCCIPRPFSRIKY